MWLLSLSVVHLILTHLVHMSCNLFLQLEDVGIVSRKFLAIMNQVAVSIHI